MEQRTPDVRRPAPPNVVRPFRPPWWLASPHAQTIGGKLLRPRVRVPLGRERIDTPDGDVLELDFTPGDRTRPRVVVLHGLEGSSRRRYMTLTYQALRAVGLEAVGLNFRGCAGRPNRTARAYHSGETGDLRLVLELLRRRFPGPLGAVGFSLGGNVLLKYLGETGSDAKLAAAVAVSVPFDLAAGADTIARGVFGRLLYTPYFLRSLKRKTIAKADLVKDRCDLDQVRAARTLRAFDDAVTAPIHGFVDAADYYERSSSVRFLHTIRTPTLVLHAWDDPFLPARHIPTGLLQANPAITTAIPDRGGHVGFVHGTLRRPRFWAETEAARFLAARLGST